MGGFLSTSFQTHTSTFLSLAESLTFSQPAIINIVKIYVVLLTNHAEHIPKY